MARFIKLADAKGIKTIYLNSDSIEAVTFNSNMPTFESQPGDPAERPFVANVILAGGIIKVEDADQIAALLKFFEES